MNIYVSQANKVKRSSISIQVIVILKSIYSSISLFSILYMWYQRYWIELSEWGLGFSFGVLFFLTIAIHWTQKWLFYSRFLENKNIENWRRRTKQNKNLLDSVQISIAQNSIKLSSFGFVCSTWPNITSIVCVSIYL